MVIVSICFLILITLLSILTLVEIKRRKSILKSLVSYYDIRSSLVFYLLSSMFPILFIIPFKETIEIHANIICLIISSLFILATLFINKFKVLINDDKVVVCKLFCKKEYNIKDITYIKITSSKYIFYINKKVIFKVNIKYKEFNLSNFCYISETCGSNVHIYNLENSKEFK